MKNYKDYEKTMIGDSDIASLTVRGCKDIDSLDFGEDGIYNAYIVNQDTEIPEHYYEVFETDSSWLWIYDDTGVFKLENINGNGFAIYRAGERGCIIQKL